MRPRRPVASPLSPKIRFAFTDRPIIVWAGTILLRLYCEWIGLRACLTTVLAPFHKRSNNQILAVDRLLCWFYGLALGVERFEHVTRYRRDPLLPNCWASDGFLPRTRCAGWLAPSRIDAPRRCRKR